MYIVVDSADNAATSTISIIVSSTTFRWIVLRIDVVKRFGKGTRTCVSVGVCPGRNIGKIGGCGILENLLAVFLRGSRDKILGYICNSLVSHIPPSVSALDEGKYAYSGG